MKRSLKKYFIRKYGKSGFKAAPYPGYENLSSVAVIFDPEMEEAVQHFADELTKDGKAVTLLGYIPRKRKEIETKPGYNYVCSSDVKWHGIPLSDEMKIFLEAEYELFIDVLSSKVHPLDIITETVCADFKIGRMLRKNKGYNLTLEAGKTGGGKPLFEEINYYIKFINRNK